MKAIQFSIIGILTCVLIFTACKKKDSSTPPPASTTGTLPVLNTMTAKVDNVNWAMINTPLTGVVMTKSGNSYAFAGLTDFSSPYTSINLGFLFGTGTYTIGVSGGVYASYRDTANIFFSANTGTITVTQVDTLPQNQGILNKFKATFSFITNAVSGKSYTVTNGSVDYDKSR